MKNKNKSLMLDSKKKGKKKNPHTAKWKRCFKKVSKEETDETSAKIYTDSVGYEESFKEKSKHESIDEKNLLSLIKEKENPRMTKKGLIEYIKSSKKKEVIKSTNKKGMVSEALSNNLGTKLRYFKGEKGAITKVMKYLEMIRQSGLENMHGAHPILNWAPDDLHRYLYGKSMDLDSLDDDDRDKKVIEYLVNHKQEVRDILTRVALRKAEELGDHEMNTIQRHFNQASREAFEIWVGIMSI
tara:strand:+ start:257 stop:982 length:726 start_codon:yes stop_codon:yes gene_type:complete